MCLTHARSNVHTVDVLAGTFGLCFAGTRLRSHHIQQGCVWRSLFWDVGECEYLHQWCIGYLSFAGHFPDSHSSAVTFAPESVGRIAMVIYEFADVRYLGKTTESDGNYPVSPLSYG